MSSAAYGCHMRREWQIECDSFGWQEMWENIIELNKVLKHSIQARSEKREQRAVMIHSHCIPWYRSSLGLWLMVQIWVHLYGFFQPAQLVLSTLFVYIYY